MHYLKNTPGTGSYEVTIKVYRHSFVAEEKVWPTTPGGAEWAEAAAVCSWLNGGAKPDFIF